jgi:hypothetical protein
MKIKFDELNNFSRTPSKDICRWKEMAQWLHETTSTIKSEGAAFYTQLEQQVPVSTD